MHTINTSATRRASASAATTAMDTAETVPPPVVRARRWLVTVGLVGGPVLVVAGAMIGLGHEPGSMRAIFDDLGTRSNSVLLQSAFELIGFTIVLASFAGVTAAIRSRGAVLGTIGAVFSLLGIAGFGLANGTGMTVLALAQLPNHDAAFDTAVAITQTGPLVTASTVGWLLEIVGQIGMLLVLLGLWRARVTPIWPALLCIVGVALVAALGIPTVLLAADVLLLVIGVWVALRVACTSVESLRTLARP